MSDSTPTQNQQETNRNQSSKPIALIILGLMLFCLFILVVWQSVHTRNALNTIEKSLAEKLEKFNAQTQQNFAIANSADNRSNETQARLATLEQQFYQSEDQQQSLELLYRELSNNREIRVISEVEQLLIIANQQLQLAANVKSALVALQTADSRLQELDSAQAIALRKSLLQNITSLQDMPQTDIVGISLKLANMASNIDHLPLNQQVIKQTPITPAQQNLQGWQALTQEIWHDLTQLIEIERVRQPHTALLTKEQDYFLRENLKLRLLSARIALMQHEQTLFKTDIQNAMDWLNHYFDLHTSAGHALISELQQINQTNLDNKIPDIQDSLSMASTYKLTLEHAGSINQNKAGNK